MKLINEHYKMGCGASKSKSIEVKESPRSIVIKSTLIRKQTRSFGKEYQNGNKIGTGGFAEVRRCTHKLTGTMRAVKIYHKDLFPEEYVKSGGLLQ